MRAFSSRQFVLAAGTTLDIGNRGQSITPMAAKGISLHIGLNRVDPAHYDGWDGTLLACEFDANDLEAIARRQGFTPRKLLTEEATSEAVVQGIRDAAASLRKGDIFLLTYSGHGGQVPDTNHDEKKAPTGLKDKQDETWVLFDRQVVDDELFELWSRFKPGVRIFVLSDSCHSGTVVRVPPPQLSGAPPGVKYRLMPPDVAERTYKKNAKLYRRIQKENPTAEKARVSASVVLISGCQDNQFSLDGQRNGLFTENLLATWRDGKFKGAYPAFREQIGAKMPPSQTPNYFVVGKANPSFEAQKPFSI